MNNNCFSKIPYRLVKQSGLSLVELMISITISLVIMGGVLQLYASATRNASSAQGVSRLQENIRYAVARLGNDIARAGNMGCFSLSAVGAPSAAGDDQQGGTYSINKSVFNYLTNRYEVIVNPSDVNSIITIDEDDNVVVTGGNDTVWYDFENSFISGDNNDSIADVNVLDGTDTLIVKYVDNSSTIAIKAIPNDSSFTLESIDGLADGDVAFAGDCNKLYVFNLDDVGVGGDNVSIANGFSHDIDVDTFSKFYTGESGAYRYYIGGEGCTAGGVGRANCSLFRSLNSDGVGQELIAGVHDFQVAYGYEGVNADTVQVGGRLTVDRVEVTLGFNAMDSGTLLAKTITHVFAVRNQL